MSEPLQLQCPLKGLLPPGGVLQLQAELLLQVGRGILPHPKIHQSPNKSPAPFSTSLYSTLNFYSLLPALKLTHTKTRMGEGGGIFICLFSSRVVFSSSSSSSHIASTESAKSRNETQLFGRKTPATFHKYSQRTVFFLSSAMFLFCFKPCALTASGIPAPPRCLRPCRPAGPTDSRRNFPVLGRRL